MHTLRACTIAAAALLAALAGAASTGDAASVRVAHQAASILRPQGWTEAGMAMQSGWEVRMPRIGFPSPN
jgi:hypothetical protein